MKKRSKVLAFMMSVSFTALILAGCSTNGATIYSAIKKSNSINSAEVQTDIKLNVSANNMSESEKNSMKDVLTKFNGAELHVLTKFNQNSKKTILKSQTDISAKAGKDEFKTTIWTNSDSSKEQPTSTEIIKVPKVISDDILELKGKDYIVATSDGDTQANVIDYKKISELEPKLTAFIDAYMKNYNPVNDPIKKLGNKTITQNGKQKNVTVYQFTLNDNSLKTLLHYTVNNLPNNKESLNLLKDYLISVVSVVSTSKDEATKATDEVENAFTNFNNNLSDIVKQCDSALSEFDKVKILGDKGISIQFAIDNSGFIVNTQGDIEVVIDTANISKVLGDTSGTFTGVYTATIHFSNDIRNINGNVNITYPKTTTKNSVTIKQSSLSSFLNIYNAHSIVNEAVKSNNLDTIDAAKQFVLSLPDGKDKTSMLSQLDKVSNELLSAKAKELIKKAKGTLLISDYENAYAVINKLPKSTNKSLLAELTSVSKKVYTSDVNAALTKIKTFVGDKAKDLKKYNIVKQSINNGVKNAKNRDYLINKLNSVGYKEVFTDDVVKALNAIEVAKKKYTNANVAAAKTAISKVKNKESAKYLQIILDSMKSK